MGFRDWWQGKPVGAGRSSQWPAVRAKHLKENSFCLACGRREKLEVHHIVPFHKAPERELDPTNLMTLCEGPTNCHFLFGHLGDWRIENRYVRADAAEFNRRRTEARILDKFEEAARNSTEEKPKE